MFAGLDFCLANIKARIHSCLKLRLVCSVNDNRSAVGRHPENPCLAFEAGWVVDHGDRGGGHVDGKRIFFAERLSKKRSCDP
mmetsp:Transcript_11227/g.24545  ORF Transcript_11227/g.24545 Transcript_11227/m.24545 type:complete len:82 (-) Transcript_11227:627-872(-)